MSGMARLGLTGSAVVVTVHGNRLAVAESVASSGLVVDSVEREMFAGESVGDFMGWADDVFACRKVNLDTRK